MFKKVLAVFMAVLLLSFTFAGCTNKRDETPDGAIGTGTEASTTAQPQEETTAVQLDPNAKLKVWFGLFPEENKALTEIGKEFTGQYGVQVEVIDSNFFEVRQKFLVAASGPDAPDLILAQAADLGGLVEGGVLRSLDLIDSSIDHRFSTIALDAFKYDGKQYGIGYSADAYGIVYNKKLISEVPKTWGELFTKAEELTVKDAKGKVTQQGLLINPTGYWFVYPLIAKHGGYYFGKNADGSFNSADIGLANEGSVKAFNEMLSLKARGMTTETAQDDESIISQRFSEGKVAMMIYALWSAQSYKDAGVDYGYAPLPANDDGTVSKPLGSVLGIVANKYSKYAKEADAFLKYMMEDAAQRKLYEAANGGDAKNGQRNTLNNEVYNSEYVQSDANLKALADVSMNCEVFPSNPEASVIWNYSKAALDNIFFNNKPVEDSLKELDAKVKEDIAKIKK